MALTVQPFENTLDGLSRFLARAGLEADEAGPPFEVVGPFPSFSLNPVQLGDGQWDAAELTGWRALVRQGERSLAVLDIVVDQGRPSYSMRGEEAARAFEKVLQQSARFEARQGNYEVRWLSLASIFVTTLWLFGPEEYFIPTRLGGAERERPAMIGKLQFQDQVAALARVATRYKTLGGAETDENVMPGSKSGL